MFYAGDVSRGHARVEGETAQHLRRVLRAEPGQRYELSDGRRLYLGEVTGFARDAVEFKIVEELPARRGGARVVLYAALLKFDRFEWLIEKATELGTPRLVPVVAARSDTGLEKAAVSRLARWRRIAMESGQQCRRVSPMEIDAPRALGTVLASSHPVRLFLDEDGGAPLLARLSLAAASAPEETEIALLAGPEGGWAPSERSTTVDAGWTSIFLGDQVLRAETAALAALSIVQAWWWGRQDLNPRQT